MAMSGETQRVAARQGGLGWTEEGLSEAMAGLGGGVDMGGGEKRGEAARPGETGWMKREEALNEAMAVEIGSWFVDLGAAMILAKAYAELEGGVKMGAGDERA
jgi:hypothetical protein